MFAQRQGVYARCAAIQESNALVGTGTVNASAGTYGVTGRLDIEDDLILAGAGLRQAC